MATERFDETHEDAHGNVWSLTGWYTYDDATGNIQRLDWDNGFPHDIRITFRQGAQVVETTIRANRSGFRGNIPGAWNHFQITYEINHLP